MCMINDPQKEKRWGFSFTSSSSTLALFIYQKQASFFAEWYLHGALAVYSVRSAYHRQSKKTPPLLTTKCHYRKHVAQ